MAIFTIIIFGLAVFRSIIGFTKEETYKSAANFVAQVIFSGTLFVAYIWFLNQITI